MGATLALLALLLAWLTIHRELQVKIILTALSKEPEEMLMLKEKEYLRAKKGPSSLDDQTFWGQHWLPSLVHRTLFLLLPLCILMLFTSFLFFPYEPESLMALRGITLLKVITLEMTDHENYIFGALRGTTTNQQFCALVKHCSGALKIFLAKYLEEFTRRDSPQKKWKRI